MSYRSPSNTAANFTWDGQAAYSAPSAGSADLLFAYTRLGLLFKDPAASNGDLVFKPEGVQFDLEANITGSFQPLAVSLIVAAQVEATITGTFSPLQVSIQAGPREFATITGAFDAMTFSMEASYTSNANRPVAADFSTSHQSASATEFGVTQPQQTVTAKPIGWEAFWQKTLSVPIGAEAIRPGAQRKEHPRSATGFDQATPVSDIYGFKHEEASHTRDQHFGRFENATKVRDSTFFKHEDGTRIRWTARPIHQNAEHTRTLLGGSFRGGTRFVWGRSNGYQEAVPPPPGIEIIPVIPEPQPCYLPDSDLVFSWPSGHSFPTLRFTCLPNYVAPPQPVVVPVQKVYIVINNATLRRVDGNIYLPTLSMSLSLDFGSWTWGFSASLPATTLANLEPSQEGDPVEVEAMINGTAYRALVEDISRDRSFGRASIKISGRGKSATLDAPYAPISMFGNTIERTAQQLMNDVLTLNGSSLGWTVDWQMEDWLVPAEVFSHQGTYISALNQIVKAGGGYLQPHPSAQTVRALHLYPSAPWEWDEAFIDYELPASVTTGEGIKWVEKPRYNRVFVSGTSAGVLGQVTRTGTAGDLLAPMVTDPLITSAVAARRRGISVLAPTGRQASVNLRLPVLQQTGIITPGKMVRYVDGSTTRVGITRSVQVDVKSPDIFQQIEVETYA